MGENIVQARWDELPNHDGQMVTDAFVAMPNHVHGIIVITDAPIDAHVRTGAACCAPTTTPHRTLRTIGRDSLGAMVRSFKSAVTKRINQSRATPSSPVWRRNYYERVIRDMGEMNRIREYIAANPAQWANDENNPMNRHIPAPHRVAPTITIL
jgi:putative transposase